MNLGTKNQSYHCQRRGLDSYRGDAQKVYPLATELSTWPVKLTSAAMLSFMFVDWFKEDMTVPLHFPFGRPTELFRCISRATLTVNTKLRILEKPNRKQIALNRRIVKPTLKMVQHKMRVSAVKYWN